MRISTSQIYNANVTSLNNLQVQIANTTQQMATGQRILSPADDPVGAARASELIQSDSTNTQYTTNRTAAINTLSLADGVLDGVTSLLQDVHTTVVSASGLSDGNRKALALHIQSRLNDLLGMANSTDGAGSYLFSGAQGSVKPFVDTAGGVVYQGDDVQRKVQVASARQLSSTDSGADIFMRARNGNGTFQAAPDAANTGSGIISQGVVTDSSQYTGQSYTVVFTSATNYDIRDVPGGTTLASGAYVSGQAISYGGIQVEIKGTPSATDSFDISPSENMSVFDTLNNLVQLLNTPLAGATAAVVAANSQAMSDALGELGQGLNTVLGVRATIGSRLNELDSLQAMGDQLGLQFKATLSKIQDTDYNKAITDLTQQKLMLQAAQQSFAQVSKLSLFNFI
ncbi:MAG: flagellar hook-associated protein FlgL [Sideroxyarcus sp.]|nr:flagellar hook-associated protein FlgL [Sideroxyarcus sp.]